MDIMEMTVDQILLINELAEVAKEAKEAAEAINRAYAHAFGIGEDRIEVWSDSNNFEYLTHDGVWQARYLHQTYDVKCTADEIFKYFRAEYMVKHGFAKEYENSGFGGCYLTEEGKLMEVVRYLRSFINKVLQMVQR